MRDDLRCRIEALVEAWKPHNGFDSSLQYCLDQSKECGERWATVDTDWQNTVRLHTNVCEGLLNLENDDE